jgi:hypothetical protein
MAYMYYASSGKTYARYPCTGSRSVDLNHVSIPATLPALHSPLLTRSLRESDSHKTQYQKGLVRQTCIGRYHGVLILFFTLNSRCLVKKGVVRGEP